MPSPHLRKVRVAAWVGLIVIAAIQGWAFRHFISPDGIAYLDLSDAIPGGRLGDLINGYWSPAYPMLLGLMRWALAGTRLGTPYWEFFLVHLLNLACFVAALASFEWFLRALAEAGARWGPAGGQQPFESATGRATAYVLFGGLSLIMISVKSPTPDMLAAALTFAAFACMLQLQVNPASTVRAVQLGIVLALGALTKSFFFPLGALMIATVAASGWLRGGRRAALAALSAFVAFALPWCVALSVSLGHFSTGETGRLNYVWWVNRYEAPQSGFMPSAAAPRDSLPLSGLAVMPGSAGTNPLWYDPVRWQPDAKPRFAAAAQWRQLAQGLTFYVAIAAPLVLALVVVAAGSRWSDLRRTLERSGVVLFPSLAALGAYALVYTASRYLAPFLIASALALAASYPRDTRLRASRMALALSLTLLMLDALSPMRSRVFITYGLVLAVGAVVLWRSRSGWTRWMLTAATAGTLIWIVTQLPSLVVRGATLLVGLALWIALANRPARDETPAADRLLLRAIGIGAVAASLVPGLIDGYYVLERWRAGTAGVVHPQWVAAQAAINGGSPPGSHIALVGSPYNVGWARLARYHIVAVVPEPRVNEFWALPPADRQRIVQAFHAAGARRFISGVEP